MSSQEAYRKMRRDLGLDSKSGYKDSGVGNGILGEVMRVVVRHQHKEQQKKDIRVLEQHLMEVQILLVQDMFILVVMVRKRL